MNPSRGVTLAALLFLASSCADAAREAEIACQRRLIAVAGEPPGPPGESRLTRGFSAMSRNFARMPLDGCSEGQRYQARRMAMLTQELALLAARIGDPLKAAEQEPRLRTNQAFLELESGIEQLQHRRRALNEDLDRMIAGDR